MPKLQISLPDGSDASYDLLEDVVTVGRVPDNTIQIEDPSVSSHHAQLSLAAGGDYTIQDLDSTNGTMVNGERISEAHLRDGDKVLFGKIESVYASEIVSEARPMPAAGAVAVTPAAESHRPADFGSVAPFAKKEKKKDPVGRMIFAFAGFAVLVFIGAMVSIYLMQAPP